MLKILEKMENDKSSKTCLSHTRQTDSARSIAGFWLETIEITTWWHIGRVPALQEAELLPNLSYVSDVQSNRGHITRPHQRTEGGREEEKKRRQQSDTFNIQNTDKNKQNQTCLALQAYGNINVF